MVYLAIPFIGLGAAGFLGYTVTKTFNVAENAVVNQVYGPTEAPYPWPPINLADEPVFSNSTTMGSLAAAAAFVITYRVNRRFLFDGLSKMKLQGAPAPGGKIETLSQFAAETAGPFLAVYANSLASSALAGGVKPLVDGNPEGKKLKKFQK
mmetsp:Transcript_907/g.1606  ORF Transcript_907/g.1606 Transcript_907/m.1606 type:complete len:152 (+) Transcript_907:442-897(+)